MTDCHAPSGGPGSVSLVHRRPPGKELIIRRQQPDQQQAAVVPLVGAVERPLAIRNAQPLERELAPLAKPDGQQRRAKRKPP